MESFNHQAPGPQVRFIFTKYHSTEFPLKELFELLVTKYTAKASLKLIINYILISATLHDLLIN